MILATDEVFTYAIFNYLEINWSSHTEAGGDTTTGEGGVPAYVSVYLYKEKLGTSNVFPLLLLDYVINILEYGRRRLGPNHGK